MMIDPDVFFKNSIAYRFLVENGAINRNKISPYASRVRDRDDVKAYRCDQSGVIFLDRSDHINLDYYIEKNFDGMLAVGDSRVSFTPKDNTEHQISQLSRLIDGKDWLDFGCGSGSILRKLGSKARSAVGVEPARWHREAAKVDGLTIVGSLNEIDCCSYDIITLFHVFEHLLDPIGIAQSLKSCLRPGGLLLIEVPHARDFLLETLDSESFRAFTLWSEHLILHTRESLEIFLRKAGFGSVEVAGIQRYPLSNHLYWLRHQQPGGHEKWPFINSKTLDVAYESLLVKIDQTDTIVGYARI